MNKFQYLIIVAGLFQIISQGMDQYVIQKEQVIRNLENKIFKNNFTIEEYYNTNKTYYQIYHRLSTNSDLKLKLINNKNTDENIRKDHILIEKDT